MLLELVKAYWKAYGDWCEKYLASNKEHQGD